MNAVTPPATSTSLDADRSSYRPPSVADVDLAGFWGERADAVASRTVRILYDRCVAAGMLDQFDPDHPVPELRYPWQRRADGTQGTVNVQMFWDSDFAKVIEAYAYASRRQRDPALEADIDAVVDMFARLQLPDGYLNSWFIRREPDRRWRNLRDCHELYCAGHLIEAAVAYAQATGKRKLLEVMIRYADHIAAVFGPDDGQIKGYDGHEEIELALVRLARATGQRRFLDLARFFIDQRGQQPHFFDEEALRDGREPAGFHHGSYEYSQSHLPVRKQARVVGHAVRAMYLYSGMADVAAETGDDSLTEALEALWSDLTERQMYVTGGIGPQASNEGFTAAYDLPNESAYAETCASVGLVFWASRMLGRGPDRRFADIMELALYNGALAGLSRDGATFFYDNKLESRGDHRRWEWHHCPCCPPNLARLVGSVGTYAYGVRDGAVAVHLYVEGTARLMVGSVPVTLIVEGAHPYAEKATLTVRLDQPATFDLELRVPGWASGASAWVNDEAADMSAVGPSGYLALRRTWLDGDRVELHLSQEPRLLVAHPRVRADTGRVALARGPLVYCAEGADNGADLDMMALQPEAAAEARTTELPELGQARALDLPVRLDSDAAWANSLYRVSPAPAESAVRRFIPYHLWDNREPGEMLVWVRQSQDVSYRPGPDLTRWALFV